MKTKHLVMMTKKTRRRSLSSSKLSLQKKRKRKVSRVQALNQKRKKTLSLPIRKLSLRKPPRSSW